MAAEGRIRDFSNVDSYNVAVRREGLIYRVLEILSFNRTPFFRKIDAFLEKIMHVWKFTNFSFSVGRPFSMPFLIAPRHLQENRSKRTS